MYETKSTLKNVNIRAELSGEEQKNNAFDLSIDMPYTDELHDLLFSKVDEAVKADVFRTMMVDNVKFNVEHEMVDIIFGEQRVEQAKLNNITYQFGEANDTVKVRIQALVGNAHGIVEDINQHTGSVLHLSFMDDLSEVELAVAQMDLLPNEEEKTDAPPPKKKAKSKAKAKAKAKNKTKQKEGESQELHVVGGETEDLSTEEIARRKKEKEDVLLRNKPLSDSNPEDELTQQVGDMVAELSQISMGQGDDHTFKTLKDKVVNGRKLTAYQLDELQELHGRYAA